MTKFEAVFEYLKKYPPLYDILYFNKTQEYAETTSVNTVYSDYAVQEYTCGNSDREFIFAIKQMKTYDASGTSGINRQSIADVQAFMDWIDEQNANKNFPEFPENCTVYKIENLQNMPELSGTNDQGNAEYMFQCRICYTERRNINGNS